MSKVEEIYDHHIWKELEKDDAVPPEVILFLINKFMLLRHLFNIQLSATLQVYLNALGLLIRLDVRDALDGFEDRLKNLAVRLTNQVSHTLVLYHPKTVAVIRVILLNKFLFFGHLL